MPKNRFTISQRITERQLTGLAYDFVLGVNAKRCAERVRLSEKSVRRYFTLLRRRIAEDSEIIGELVDLPEADAPVWKSIERCIWDCPMSVDTRHGVRPEDLGLFLARKELGRRARLKSRRKLGGCTDCPFGKPYEAPSLILLYMDLDKALTRDSRIGMRERYIEAAMRAALLNPNAPFGSHNTLIARLLKSCRTVPI